MGYYAQPSAFFYTACIIGEDGNTRYASHMHHHKSGNKRNPGRSFSVSPRMEPRKKGVPDGFSINMGWVSQNAFLLRSSVVYTNVNGLPGNLAGMASSIICNGRPQGCGCYNTWMTTNKAYWLSNVSELRINCLK